MTRVTEKPDFKFSFNFNQFKYKEPHMASATIDCTTDLDSISTYYEYMK